MPATTCHCFLILYFFSRDPSQELGYESLLLFSPALHTIPSFATQDSHEDHDKPSLSGIGQPCYRGTKQDDQTGQQLRAIWKCSNRLVHSLQQLVGPVRSNVGQSVLQRDWTC